MLTIISLGGSIIAPNWVNTAVCAHFMLLVRRYLREKQDRKLVLVVGGGGPARKYQESYRKLVDEPDDLSQDWIGIMATRLNAELLRAVCGDLCNDPVVINPEGDFAYSGRVLVAAGWKPGFSTDYDAVILAERFHAQRIINISNIAKVYSADPKSEVNAVPLDTISWAEYQAMVGEKWTPGKNLPFDPIASKRAAERNMEVLFVGGDDMENIGKVLEGRKFFGTRIGG